MCSINLCFFGVGSVIICFFLILCSRHILWVQRGLFKLTIPMMRLRWLKAQECNDLRKPKSCHVGFHWKVLAEY